MDTPYSAVRQDRHAEQARKVDWVKPHCRCQWVGNAPLRGAWACGNNAISVVVPLGPAILCRGVSHVHGGPGRTEGPRLEAVSERGAVVLWT